MNSEFSYSLWEKEHQPILENFGNKNIILLFSGGKDSSVALDLMLTAGEKFGFDFTAHAAAFPVHRYTDAEMERIESYWAKRKVNITWHHIAQTDDSLKHSENPCRVCQLQRKKLLNDILTGSIEDWSNLVLIVCYSLWDIVSYSVEHLLGDILADSDRKKSIEAQNRFQETAQRFYSIIKMKEGYTVFRPMIRYNNNDINKMIARQGIPVISIPCQFKDFRPKRILENYYQKMGLSFNYDQLLDFARTSLNLPDSTTYSSIAKENYLLNVF